MFYKVPSFKFFGVTKDGIVKNIKTDNILKPDIDKDGYLTVRAKYQGVKEKAFIHRLVALTFIPNPESKPYVNHINSIRNDNRIENLEWVTAKENATHASEFGNLLKGENSPNSNYTLNQIKMVCEMLELKYKRKDISDKTGVSLSVIDDIKAKRTWVDISSQYNIPSVKRNLTDDVVKDICEMLCKKECDNYILSIFKDNGLTVGSLRFIKLKKTFKHITCNYEWE